MSLFKTRASASSSTTLLVVLTLLASGLFKVAAFGREAYIAAKFGLSTSTDTYFALQQLPLSIAAFMFGAFTLAFTPAYAQAKARGDGSRWLPGLLLYLTVVGLALTAVTIGLAPVLLRVFARATGADGFTTLVTLSVCYVPVIYLALWAAICNGKGRTVYALILTGLPYLLMTLTMVALCEWKHAGRLALPISMTAGFATVGVFSIINVFRTESMVWELQSLLWPFGFEGFRTFLRQLLAAAVENVGFSLNQMSVLYFFALTGPGGISANNCAMRLGLLANSVVAAPLAQVAQSQFCISDRRDRRRVFVKFFGMACVFASGIALASYLLRRSLVSLVYMRGRFTALNAAGVTELLPAWSAYFVVLALNAIVARYLFANGRGAKYTWAMLGGYTLANALRLAISGNLPPVWIIWSAVIGEGVALTVSLWYCLSEPRRQVVCSEPVLQGDYS